MGELARRERARPARARRAVHHANRSVPVALDAGARSVDHLALPAPRRRRAAGRAECAAVLLPGAELLGAEHVRAGPRARRRRRDLRAGHRRQPRHVAGRLAAADRRAGGARATAGARARRSLAVTLNAAWVLGLSSELGLARGRQARRPRRARRRRRARPVPARAQPGALVIVGGELAWVRDRTARGRVTRVIDAADLAARWPASTPIGLGPDGTHAPRLDARGRRDAATGSPRRRAALGLRVERDPAGNLWALPDGDGPVVGGRLAPRQRARAAGASTARSASRPRSRSPRAAAAASRSISFADEEGARFNTPTFGSARAGRRLDVADVLAPRRRRRRHARATRCAPRASTRTGSAARAGVARAAARLRRAAHRPDDATSTRAGAPFGVVARPRRAAARCALELRGRADHAGTTPTAERRDALAAAAPADRRRATTSGRAARPARHRRPARSSSPNALDHHRRRTCGCGSTRARRTRRRVDAWRRRPSDGAAPRWRGRPASTSRCIASSRAATASRSTRGLRAALRPRRRRGRRELALLRRPRRRAPRRAASRRRWSSSATPPASATRREETSRSTTRRGRRAALLRALEALAADAARATSRRWPTRTRTRSSATCAGSASARPASARRRLLELARGDVRARRRARPRLDARRRACASTARWRAAGYGAVGEFHYVHHRPDGTPYEDPNALAIDGRRGRARGRPGDRAAARRLPPQRLGRRRPPAARRPAPLLRPGRRDVPRARRRAARLGRRPPASASASPRTASAPCPRAGCEAIAAYADEHGLVRHVHAPRAARASSPSAQAEHGCSPIELLHRTGFLGPRTSVIHGIHVVPRRRRAARRHRHDRRDLPDDRGQPRRRLPARAGLPRRRRAARDRQSDSQVRVDPFEEAARAGDAAPGASAGPLRRCWPPRTTCGRERRGRRPGVAGRSRTTRARVAIDPDHPQLAGIPEADLPRALVTSASAAVVAEPAAPAV